ncbi:hypothetical protein Tco_0801545 [Tanacetum coccineum]|uniref:Uncharacterized protein n=1 Tax=Tanacetum coccineum TaxID=301880 RepID=A0ABQ4ZX42_9ASTR
MSSASLMLPHFVLHRLEPGRAFWEPMMTGISRGRIPRAHDPNYVPEPIYPEYIPLEDDHEFPAEEQPLPPIDSPTAESPGYITESDPEEDPEGYEDDETEDGPVVTFHIFRFLEYEIETGAQWQDHPIVTFPLRPDFGGVTDGTRAKFIGNWVIFKT